MFYTAFVHIPREEIARINELLAIEDLDTMSNDELLASGANTDYSEGVYYVEFEDGSHLTFDLCSGQTNYWDDVIWTSPEGEEVVFDCDYEIGDIFFEENGNTYNVQVVPC